MTLRGVKKYDGSSNLGIVKLVHFQCTFCVDAMFFLMVAYLIHDILCLGRQMHLFSENGH